MIKLEYCRLEDQIADILTKPLKIDALIKVKRSVGHEGGCSKSELREDVGY